MTNTTAKEKSYKWIKVFLLTWVVMVNVRSILVDFDVDSEYAIAMSYRMILGDKMIAQMWEPHQTSGFLMAILMQIYLWITGTTTGIVLYLHVCGVLIKSVFAVTVYKTLSKWINRDLCFLIGIFFFAVYPKGIPLPEFSNMQIWFSLGLFCSLLLFLQQEEKRRWLIAASVFLCLEILSYPSCLIVFFGVALVLFLFSKEKWKNILVFTGACALQGGAFIAYFLVTIGPKAFVTDLRHVMFGDTSHSQSLGEKMATYLNEFGGMLLEVLAIAFVAGLIVLLFLGIGKILKKDVDKKGRKLFAYSFWILFFVRNMVDALLANDRYGYLVIYIPILFMALYGLKKCNEIEKRIVSVGVIISFLGFLAVVLLTNLLLDSCLSYLILGVMVSFIPAARCLEEIAIRKTWIYRYGLIILFLVTVLFRGVYIIKPMPYPVDSILNIRGIVKSGPAAGIISEYMGPYIINNSMEEWNRYVKDGDRILLVAEGTVSTLGYLYGDTEVSAASTICTPTYNENLLTYWEENPEKFPNMIIVSCWYGELKISQDSWIMQWIEEEFKPDEVNDGKYWRYYRKN